MKGVIAKYNPLRDACEVVSGLAVDVTDMMNTGIVHSGTSNQDSNGIDDPNNIIGRVVDEFAAIDAMRVIRKYGKKKPEKVAAAAAAATDSTNPASN